MAKKTRNPAKYPLQIIEHRGNDQEVKNNYLMEMKLVHKAPKAQYSVKGGRLDL